MNLVRHELGYSKLDSRFPAKATCLVDLLAVRQRPSAAGGDPSYRLSVVRGLGRWSCAPCLPAMWRPSRSRTSSITMTCCSTGPRPSPTRSWRPRSGRGFDHVLVDEYQDTNRLQASILLALKPDGVGLTVVGDDAQSIYAFRAATGAQHPGLPRPLRPGGDGDDPGAQLSLDPADPDRRQCGDRTGRRALHQEPVDRAAVGWRRRGW